MPTAAGRIHSAELLASERDVDRVTQEAEQAKQAGIDGVPCFILGGVSAVSGAQDPAYLADAIGRAAKERSLRTLARQADGIGPAFVP